MRTALFGIQMQRNVDNWPALYQNKGIFNYKSIMSFERCREVPQDAITVCRQDICDQGYYLNRCDTWQGAVDAAAEYINTFRDSAIVLTAEGVVDYWESLNETYSPDSQTVIRAANFDSAFAWLLPQLVPGAKPAVMTAGVGNPEPAYMDLFIDTGLMEHTVAANGVFCIHSYWQTWYKQTPWNHPEWMNNPDILKFYAMRWNMMDEVFLSRGYAVKWLLTEGGAIGVIGGDPTNLNSINGWRHPEVYNSDLDAYMADMVYYDGLLTKTKAYNEGRFLGWHLFVAGYSDPWEWFDLDAGNLVSLGNFAMGLPELPVPQPVPPPIPPPNPTPYDPVPFSQRDPRWKDELLGYSTTYTIGSAGCALTCSAMIAAVVNDEVDPSTLNERMQNIGGFSGALIIWDKLEEAVDGVQWGGATRWYDIPADLGVLAAELNEYPTIVLVDFYPGGDLQTHFVLATGFTDDGQDLYIIDPWDGAKTQLLLRYGGQSGWDLQRALYGMYRVRAIDVTPPVDPCWCWPRVQYSRLVWVPYVAAPNSTVVDIYKAAGEAGITCAMSVDDAGASGCEVNKLVLWDFPVEVQGMYRAFFAEHYPHAEVEFRRWVSVDWWTRVKVRLGL